MSYYDADGITVHHGDCLDVLPALADNSVDAVCTDPPYSYAFMGRKWDSHPTPKAFQAWCQLWATECLRVLKPGGHLLAFGGTRTSHRLTCAVEDAGFEIRDSIAWLYGSGFPKSLDVSKAIDRMAGVEREIIGSKRGQPGYSLTDGNGDHRTYGRGLGNTGSGEAECAVTAPATGDARRWAGWGTALKPAWENVVCARKPMPALSQIVVARKPLAGTVAQTVLAWGTGALNVDGCRVGADTAKMRAREASTDLGIVNDDGWKPKAVTQRSYPDGATGRWPANVVLSHNAACTDTACSDGCPVREVDAQSGELTSGSGDRGTTSRDGLMGADSDRGRTTRYSRDGDSGGASRYFFVAEPDGSGVTSREAVGVPIWLANLATATPYFYTGKADANERVSYYRASCECEDSWPTTSPAKVTGGTTEAGSSSTSRSGNGTTGDLSQTDTRSTISMGTNATTTPPISSPSPLPTTNDSTLDASCVAANGGNPAASVASTNRLDPQTGTSVAKAGHSTADAVPATSPRWLATSVCGVCGSPARREAHATVKPLALMRWLVRLVTPPGGLILDPFAGSGTTLEAALLEGFRCIGIEREAEYLPLIMQRINRRRDPVAYVKADDGDGGLFDLLGESPS